MNTFGEHIRLTTFGESHGPAVGGVIDGLPARLRLDFRLIGEALARRRPGGEGPVSRRSESDVPEFLSGLTPDGTTLGTPLAFIVRNTDCRSGDYDRLRDVYRPGHADFTYDRRYGVRDHRGGGRASARETVSRVVAGAVAAQLLLPLGVRAEAVVCGAGEVRIDSVMEAWRLNRDHTVTPGERAALLRAAEEARLAGDSVGGEVACRITGLPAGLGEPVYGKVHARLAEAMAGINAVRGVEFGAGFKAASMRGSQANDLFAPLPGSGVTTLTNNAGGSLGGITTGLPVFFRVAFKPTPSIALPQATVGSDGAPGVVSVGGRHDPCVALRGAAVVEAMAALVAADILAGRGLLEQPPL